MKKKNIFSWWKNTFNARPWNSIRTRKKILAFSILFVVIYTVVNLILTYIGYAPDGTLTTEVFSFCKWIVATGTSITLADKASDMVCQIKNSDNEYIDE